jgi:6-phosphofructokinase
MVKKAVGFALGGHITTQNASFKRIAKRLEKEGYEFYGAKNGFEAFSTEEAYPLHSRDISKNIAGFVAGAGRASLTKEDGSIDKDMMQKANYFFEKHGFDIAIGSGGDDHGMQMKILKENLERKVGIYVINKTMDNDLGGIDMAVDREGKVAPYTDFTNGFQTAVSVGIQRIKNAFSGAWTNNCPYLVGHFGRETNWVGITLAYWGLADKIIYGELPDSHPGHSIEKIRDLILESQDKNEKRYGRRFAMIIVPEGTRISGIEHASGLIDPHGHHKLNPEVLVAHLKEELEIRYKLKTQTEGITYEMRNSPPTAKDIKFAEKSADVIADAILDEENKVDGLESTFKIVNGEVEAGLAPIEKVSQKRYSLYYPHPLINMGTFEVTDEIGKYYAPLFGKRKDFLGKMFKKHKVVSIS